MRATQNVSPWLTAKALLKTASALRGPQASRPTTVMSRAAQMRSSTWMNTSARSWAACAARVCNVRGRAAAGCCTLLQAPHLHHRAIWDVRHVPGVGITEAVEGHNTRAGGQRHAVCNGPQHSTSVRAVGDEVGTAHVVGGHVLGLPSCNLQTRGEAEDEELTMHVRTRMAACSHTCARCACAAMPL